MLHLNDVAIARGTHVLYENVTLTASDGERIALIGENGCGKSSLFAAILGELSVEKGDIDAPPQERIAHVAQSVLEVDAKALDYVIEGHAPLVAAKAELAAAKASGDAMREAAAIAQLADLNEGLIRSQALTIMAGLGFTNAEAEHEVKTFSGGWRNRLSLARALMCPSDLLLLDEPTNHLDMDSLIWLEAWIKRLPSTVIVISHDREFLDRAVQTTWSVENGTIVRYSGNYSAYEQQSIERMRLQEAAHRSYEARAAHLKAFIERFRYKATKARQAQSRIKMLDKLEVIEPVRAAREWRFEFAEPERTPDQLVVLEDVRAGYDDHVVIDHVTRTVRAGDRIGVLGVNGAGKSTLVKTIVGSIKPMAGSVLKGQGLAIGYFAQHQLESLDARETPLEVMRRKAPQEREQTLRDHLGKFKFSGEYVDHKIGTLSGGEKARLALALIVWDKPNLLVLDEPTNHLDMATREALTVALSGFEGALILVSHDRHLIRSTCDKLVLVHEGCVEEFEGDLDDYANLVLEHRKTVLAAERQARMAAKESDGATAPAAPAVNRREERKREAAERARIAALKKPLLAKLSKIEKTMDDLRAQLEAFDARIGDPDWYAKAGSEEIAAVTRERGETASALEAAELDWLEVSEAIEATEKSPQPTE